MFAYFLQRTTMHMTHSRIQSKNVFFILKCNVLYFFNTYLRTSYYKPSGHGQRIYCTTYSVQYSRRQKCTCIPLQKLRTYHTRPTLPKKELYLYLTIHYIPGLGALDINLSQLSPLSGVVAPARQYMMDGHGSSLCRLAGRYGNSAERA
jgi:hypothetical protein